MIKKVVVVKNIPSNIIEEASFTLKDNVEIDVDEDIEYLKYDSILCEAESLIEEYVNKYESVEMKKQKFLDKILNILNKKV